MFQLQPRYLGLDAGKNALRFAALRQIGKKWIVTSLKELSKSETLHQFYAQFKDDALVSALNTRDLLMRPCEIPLKKQKDIFAALDFHAEPLLPYPLDKAIIQARITSQQESVTHLDVYAVRSDHLSAHLDGLKTLHLEPETVTSKPHALAAFSQFLPQTGTPFLIIHEGEDELSFVLVEKQTPLIFRSIDTKKDLTAEIQKTFLSFAASKAKNFDAIYFFGKNLELKALLQQLSGKAVLFPSSPTLTLTQDELINFGLAIGTAIAPKNINFRQKDFIYPHRFKRLKKPLTAFLILSTVLSTVICFCGEMHLLHKKQAVDEAYEALLKSEKMEVKSLATPQEFHAALDAVEKKVRGRTETFSLLPQLPKVKEVLSWLTSISRTSGNDGSIVIESLHYQMVKRPDFPHKKEKYKVRVDLEFSSKDTHAARAFQEALKSSKSLADTNEEIQWTASKGKYKASFFLKDKTKYG